MLQENIVIQSSYITNDGYITQPSPFKCFYFKLNIREIDFSINLKRFYYKLYRPRNLFESYTRSQIH